jgi:hypothetical protein
MDQTRGSPAAIAGGCTCDPGDDVHGDGTSEPTGTVFLVDRDCPVHGSRVILNELTEAALTRRISQAKSSGAVRGSRRTGRR